MIGLEELIKESGFNLETNNISSNYICEEVSDKFVFGDNIFTKEEVDNIRTTLNKIRDIDSEEIRNFFYNIDERQISVRFQPSEPQLTYLCWLRKEYDYPLCVIQKRTDVTRVLENRYILNVDGLNYLIFVTEEPSIIYGISIKSQIIDGERYRNILVLEMDDNNYELKASELDDTKET
jgi:hypothetical protein